MNTQRCGTERSRNRGTSNSIEGIESLTELYTNGLERLAEVQKMGLELPFKHSAEVVSHL